MQLVSLILIHWIVIYPLDSAIQRLNNRGPVDSAIQRLNNRGQNTYTHTSAQVCNERSILKIKISKQWANCEYDITNPWQGIVSFMQTNRTAIPVLVKQGGTQLFLQESTFKNIPTKSDHKMLNDLNSWWQFNIPSNPLHIIIFSYYYFFALVLITVFLDSIILWTWKCLWTYANGDQWCN